MARKPDFRELSFRLRLTEEERAQLTALEDETGMSGNEWLRRAIKAAFEKLEKKKARGT